MEQRIGISKHVARFLAAQIDLMKIDVLRATWHRPAIEPDDLPTELVMEPSRDDPTESPADAGDDDGLHQKMCFRPARPMWIIDWMRWRTLFTFSASTSSSSSGSPSKCMSSPTWSRYLTGSGTAAMNGGYGTIGSDGMPISFAIAFK